MGRLDGRVALITGAARGMGRAHAALLASEGADVAICDICDVTDAPYSPSSPEDLDRTRQLVESAGRRCVAARVDVRDLQAMQAFTAMSVAELGQVDILCANAGILTKSVIAEMRPETWQAMIDTNLTGVFNSFRAVLPHMIERQSGSIVATSSMAARNPHGSIGHYTAAKFGVIGLVKSTAIEVGRYGIRVNAVCPTNVNTEMALNPTVYASWCPDIENPTRQDVLDRMAGVHPLGVPFVEPEDVSRSILYLVSDDARYITGEVLTVSAGLIAYSDA